MASVIAEEFDDEERNGTIKNTGASLLDFFTQNFATHQEVSSSHDRVSRSGDRDFDGGFFATMFGLREVSRAFAKTNEVTMRDTGVGNIKIATAVSVLNDYVAAYGNADPLGIAHYKGDLGAFARDLVTNERDIGVKIATLVVAEAESGLFNRWVAPIGLPCQRKNKQG